jgi:hypothetical protein
VFHPDASLVTVATACLFGISLVLRDEYKGRRPRVNELRISCAIVRGAQSTPNAVSHRAVGRKVAAIATSDTRGAVITAGLSDFE